MKVDPAAIPGPRLLEAFLNTTDERTFRRHGTAHAGGDQLTSPAALASWLAEQGLPAGKGGPGALGQIDDADLAAALGLRTTLRNALLTGSFERESASVLAGFPLHLVPDLDGTLRMAASGPATVSQLVEAVAAAVVQGTWARLKICAAPDCRWAFYDISRSGAGRWCSMEVCGNRAKTRTYRRRHGAS